MKKVNTSLSQMWRYEGKWVAIEKKTDRIIAVADDLKEIAHLVSGKKGEEDKIRASAFKVPYRNEGPYVF